MGGARSAGELLSEHVDRPDVRRFGQQVVGLGHERLCDTTGEVGLVKKQTIFSGDVVNTASRIQSMCNELKSELLISNELLRSFPPVSIYETQSVGSIHLKGKVKEVET